jgi:glyoxylase-like metal-dependent hydrolase (beta-lactamase superfamily II)
MIRLRISLCTFLITAVACSQESPPPVAETGDPSVEETPRYETTGLADGVYQFRFEGHNTLFVSTAEGIVAFDPISVEAATPYVEEIRQHIPDAELAAIVYSHRDADHATGANVLREAFGADIPIYAHENADAPLREAANPDLPPPDSTFSKQMTLAGGEVELHYFGRSHSDDIAVAFLPEHRIAFAVDFVSRDRLGYRDLASFYFPDMFGAIEGLLEIPFDRVIFGHGPAGDRATIERQLQYYRDLDRAVREAVEAGMSEDEAAADVLLEDYSDWDRYEDWRELNVRGLYRKITDGE